MKNSPQIMSFIGPVKTKQTSTSDIWFLFWTPRAFKDTYRAIKSKESQECKKTVNYLSRFL